ncbi:MAG: SCO1664 family protein [Chloroflexi bacterium]|nr:SCO1664 family protein [Chloroflexota bacterium]MCY3583761.1 SCO1664 family protein [Chloroflexota bacterium]MCY3714867.1 SCO1664 family protein [Chloroflexota bacterium]MDE2651008.1 SCO1664 family protein [Chloroflexota bacterium]MXV94227.1 SCO1664 family protein [Chloroflexota bacterium]
MTKRRVYTARALDEPVCIALDEAIAAIRHGEMDEEVGLMRWGSNYTFLVNLVHEGLRLLAIYKPRDGERPLWDFPDGTLCQRETAAYLTAEALGWSLVPPTMLRQGTRGIGSVQLFIDHNPDEHYYSFDKAPLLAQLRRMAAFDAIANNADRKGGHCLLDADGRLWGIDHGLTFNTSDKLRTVIWDFAGSALPKAILADLTRFCRQLADEDDGYTRAMRELLTGSEWQMLRWRSESLLDDGIFPLPGAGPNRPWPAV